MTAVDHPVHPVFDVCGNLPTGTTVLEASAGTGKTFTIAALAARYVAEGHARLPELLLVTFGRMATAELRDRVRARLVETERALRAPDPRGSEDRLVAHLADVDDDTLALRQERLATALAEFDAATIATTHGFCQQALAGLGTVADADRDAILVPDPADLVDEVVDDLYLRRYAAAEGGVLPVKEAREVARRAVSDHQAVIVPTDADPDSKAGQRVAFARAVRAEVARRKRARRLVDYDDLLTRLRDALADDVHGPVAVDRLRSRYRFVLVDEFQDTDPVQWEILRRAFHGHCTLVLIGDPKQAIYAFRGADVTTYLEAASDAGTSATLARSWRADEPLLRALDALFGQVALGDPRIVVQPVEAEHTGRRLVGAPPMRLRHVPRPLVGASRSGLAAMDATRALVVRDVVADIVSRLDGPERLVDPVHGERRLRPGDIAVLARRNEDAGAVREALVRAGVPAVQSALVSVFDTAAARAWLALLHALEQPGRRDRVAAVALTPFVGWDATRLATATDDERDDLSHTVRDWAHVLAGKGVAALVEAVTRDGLAERLLRTSAGERQLTDLRHVGQALHRAATDAGLRVSSLADWLQSRIDEAAQDYSEERSRRLESDAAAVQIVTVHASKGLEFPVVYAPFVWDQWENTTPDVLQLHAPDGRRLLDVGGKDGPGYGVRQQAHRQEERGEDLRLLYVALTRASSQVVLWWAPGRNCRCGPLTRLLLGEVAPGQVPPHSVNPPADEALRQRLTALQAASGDTVVVETVTDPAAAQWVPAPQPQIPLEVARFARRLDGGWRRTSYSGLTAGLHDQRVAAGVASEPEESGTVDEHAVRPGQAVAGASPPSEDPLEALHRVPLPMSQLPAGAAFGTLVHEVLEDVDTSAPDLGAELLRRCERATTGRATGLDAAELATALEPALRTPLGQLAGNVTLGDVAPADRLAELEFELPLAGGDQPRLVARRGSPGGPTLADVATVLRRYLPVDDPLAGYADRLDVPALRNQPLRGYLTGSLDAVLRVRGHDGTPRYLVVDYKTNRLGSPEEPVTAWHYRPAALAEAMCEAHYPLQLLLYLVALHRFLRWRQPGYDPQLHLGGGLYLFVRGMAGPGTPVVDGAPCGVFGWCSPVRVVTALSALLDGTAPADAAPAAGDGTASNRSER